MRLDPDGSTPVGLTIFNFIYHINSGQGIELSGVDEDLADVLISKPINQFLQVHTDADKVTAYLREPSLREAVSTPNTA